MHIRVTKLADTPRIVDIATAAFTDDELNAWLYPFRSEMPLNWRACVVRRVRGLLLNSGLHGFVSVTDDQDPSSWPRSEVAGYACWERKGIDEQSSPQSGRAYLTRLERILLGVETRYTNIFQTDRCISRERLALFNQEKELLGDPFSPLQVYWQLQILGVDPAWQGKGVGRKLMQFGLDRSQNENVPIALVASVPGRPFYQALGFKTVGWALTESCAAWAEGGAVMIHDPTETFTRGAVGRETEHTYFGRSREVDAVYTGK